MNREEIYKRLISIEAMFPLGYPREDIFNAIDDLAKDINKVEPLTTQLEKLKE